MHTDDAEEAEQTVGDLYVPHRLSARESLDARLNVAPFERITFGYLAYGAPVSLRVPPLVDSFHLNLTLRGTTRVRHGRREVRTAAQRSGVLLSTGAGSTVDWSADAAQFAMKLPRATLEAQLAALLHDTPTGPLAFDLGVDLTTPAGRGVLGAAEFLAAQLGGPGPDVHTDRMRAQLESYVLTQILLGVGNTHSARLRAGCGPAGRRTLDEAVAHIHEHAGSALGAAELAAVAGTSAEALHRAFVGRLGMSPADYVRGVRLDRAHAELRAADPDGTSVGAVARRWGFPQVRTFVAHHVARFGTDPADVLLSRAPAPG